MFKYRHLILLAAAVLAAGCAKDDAMNHADSDRLAAAKVKFEASESKPIAADTRFAAGQLAESQGDIANAFKQYQGALKLDPKHTPTLFRLALLYTNQRQFD